MLKPTKFVSNSLLLSKKEALLPFYLVLIYLFLEYGRPQTFLDFLSYLHLPALTIIALAFALYFSGKLSLKQNQTKLYIILLGLMVIHGPIAVNNYWTLMIFIAMSLNFIIYLSIANVIDSEEKYKKLVSVWLAIHIFLSIVGIIKRGRGIGGFLGDENDFCMTINMILPFAFFLALCTSGKKRIYYLLLVCLFLFVVILTQSRGGFVGLSATALYCWFRTKRKILTGLIIGFLAVFTVLVAPQSYWNEIRSITEEGAKTGTGEERLYEWRIGWHMFLDNPVMGVGQGNFPFVFKKYELEVMGMEDPFYGRSVAGRVAHSIYFTVLPELGLIGVILFGGMVYHSIKDLQFIKKQSQLGKNREKNKDLDNFYYYALALEGGLIAYLVSGAFISILYYPNFWILMAFILSLKKIVNDKYAPISKFKHS